MQKLLKIALMSSAALMASCGTVGQPQSIAGGIVNDAIELNDAHNGTSTAIIFKNILRARDRWPTTFTTLSAVRSDPSLTRGANIGLSPLGLGNPSGPFQGSNSTISNSSKAGMLYTVAPFGVADGSTTSNVLKSQDTAIFKDYFGRWPKDVITLLFVDSVTNPHTKQTYRNNGENIAAFRKDVGAALGLRGADLQGFNFKDHLKLEEIVGKPNLNDCILRERTEFASYKEFSDFAAGMKATYDGKTSIIKSKTGDVALQLCENSENAYRLTLKDKSDNPLNTPNTQQHLEFHLRSIREMVYYIGESLRHEQYVVESSCSRPQMTQDGRYVVDHQGRVATTRMMAPLFATHTNYDKLSVDYAARLRHSGEMYYTIPNSSDAKSLGLCLNDRSGMIMSILNQLLIINQSPKALESPQTFFDR